MGRYERSAGMAALMNQGSTSRASDDHSPPSPTSQVAPYDDPENNYNAGDVAMENIYASPLTSPDVFSRGDKSGTYTSLNEPLGKHAADNISLLSHHSRHPHTKHFDHNQARKNLFKVGGYKLLITISFSALMCITLRAWEGFREPEILSKIEVRIFNAIMIGLSLCLGINLLASLQNYAGILRWSLLSRRYVSLEAFDLMLGLERLSNVFKLMIISLPLVRRQKYLRKLRIFKDARQDGTKWTWLVCLIWLGINVGSQLLVAVSSLFYPMETSQFPLLTYGNVTVADLTRWHSPAEDNATTLDFEAAWMYGMEAIVYPEFAPNDTQTDLSALPGMPLYKHESSYEYRFFNRNPVHPYSDYLLSNRSVFASATCQQVEIQDNFLLRNDTENSLHGKLPGEENYTKYYFPETAGGALTWIADFTSACGARCTNFTVIQANLTSTNITQPALFLCDSKVSEVKKGNDKHDITIRNNDDSNVVFGSNFWATVASGSMGWTGLPANGWFDRQYRTYTQGSKWSPAHPVNAKEVEDILMRFTIGAIAAFDDHGMRYNVTDQHVVPTPGQQLDVDWAYILSILGGICAMQFAALCCLVIFANRTIVRDESYFSVAMLLSPVVGRIGKEGGGMNMSGDEIKNHPKLQFKKIQYSYREGKNGEPHKVDILWEGKDSRESRKSWVAGVYN